MLNAHTKRTLIYLPVSFGFQFVPAVLLRRAPGDRTSGTKFWRERAGAQWLGLRIIDGERQQFGKAERIMDHPGVESR